MGRPSNASKLAKASSMEDANKNTDQEMFKQVKGNLKKKRAITVLRKSGRIHQKVIQSTSKMVEENLIEEMGISDSDKEDGHLNNEEKTDLPEIQKTVDGRSLEEKVDYLLQAVDQLLKKPQVFNNDQYPRNKTPMKSLKSINTQKQIESLKEENSQLCKKLDIAVGKLEAYGEGNRVLLDTLKEVILSPNQAMSTKTAMPTKNPTLLLPAAEDAKKVEGVEPAMEGVAKKRGRKRLIV